MNTKLLMSASAIVLGAIGIILSFMPEEILNYTGTSSAEFLPVILQLLGAAYLGFAMLNWMAKSNLIGGIYSRPVAICNLMHFLVGGLALLKAAYVTTGGTTMWIVGGIYILFALLFAIVTFTHPVKAVKAQQAV